jgi:hypothetical protein
MLKLSNKKLSKILDALEDELLVLARSKYKYDDEGFEMEVDELVIDALQEINLLLKDV